MHPNVDKLKNNLKDRERNKVIKEVLELIDKAVEVAKEVYEREKTLTHKQYRRGWIEGLLSLKYAIKKIQELKE